MRFLQSIKSYFGKANNPRSVRCVCMVLNPSHRAFPLCPCTSDRYTQNEDLMLDYKLFMSQLAENKLPSHESLKSTEPRTYFSLIDNNTCPITGRNALPTDKFLNYLDSFL